jgi:hypothetical protein
MIMQEILLSMIGILILLAGTWVGITEALGLHYCRKCKSIDTNWKTKYYVGPYSRNPEKIKVHACKAPE